MASRSPTIEKKSFLFPTDFNDFILDLNQKDAANLLKAIIKYSDMLKVVDISNADMQKIEEWKAEKEKKINAELVASELNLIVPQMPDDLSKGLSRTAKNIYVKICAEMAESRLNWQYSVIVNQINGARGGKPKQT